MNFIKNNPSKIEINMIEVYIPFSKQKYSDAIPNLDNVLKSLNIDEKSYIKLLISAKTGKILNLNFPENISFSVDIKVRDEGVYRLFDKNDQLIKEYSDDYVPDFLPNWYGDYLVLKVVNGFLLNWKVNFEINE